MSSHPLSPFNYSLAEMTNHNGIPISSLLRDSRTPGSRSSTPQNDVIDLTLDSSPFTTMPLRRSISSSWQDSSNNHRSKRRRVGENSRRPSPQVGPKDEDIFPDFVDFTAADDVEEIDLTEKGQTRQAREAQRKQEEAEELENKLLQEAVVPTRQGKGGFRCVDLQCVICMENMENLTATHCGHLFCHTCIMQALIAGENLDGGKGTSKCPVCRKRVSRSSRAKDAQQLIPLQLKLLRKSDKARGKERARDY